MLACGRSVAWMPSNARSSINASRSRCGVPSNGRISTSTSGSSMNLCSADPTESVCSLIGSTMTVDRALQLRNVLWRQRRRNVPDDVFFSFLSVSSPDHEHRPALGFFDCLLVFHHLIDRAESLNLLAIIIDRCVLHLPVIAFPLQFDLCLHHIGPHDERMRAVLEFGGRLHRCGNVCEGRYHTMQPKIG